MPAGAWLAWSSADSLRQAPVGSHPLQDCQLFGNLRLGSVSLFSQEVSGAQLSRSLVPGSSILECVQLRLALLDALLSLVRQSVRLLFYFVEDTHDGLLLPYPD